MTGPTASGSIDPSEILQGLVGRQVVEVRYHVPVGVAAGGVSDSGMVDDVEQAIDLMVDDGSVVRAQWEMRGELEFLSVVRASGTDLIGSFVDTVDVSGGDSWGRILGRTVSGVGVAWHASGSEELRAPFAIRLDFHGATSVVIALGELVGGVPSYLPDGVLVIFDETVAANYVFPGAESPAWGISIGKDMRPG